MTHPDLIAAAAEKLLQCKRPPRSLHRAQDYAIRILAVITAEREWRAENGTGGYDYRGDLDDIAKILGAEIGENRIQRARLIMDDRAQLQAENDRLREDYHRVFTALRTIAMQEVPSAMQTATFTTRRREREIADFAAAALDEALAGKAPT